MDATELKRIALIMILACIISLHYAKENNQPDSSVTVTFATGSLSSRMVPILSKFRSRVPMFLMVATSLAALLEDDDGARVTSKEDCFLSYWKSVACALESAMRLSVTMLVRNIENILCSAML